MQYHHDITKSLRQIVQNDYKPNSKFSPSKIIYRKNALRRYCLKLPSRSISRLLLLNRIKTDCKTNSHRRPNSKQWIKKIEYKKNKSKISESAFMPIKKPQLLRFVNKNLLTCNRSRKSFRSKETNSYISLSTANKAKLKTDLLRKKKSNLISEENIKSKEKIKILKKVITSRVSTG